MAKWTSSITPINVGFSPNDGTGDSIHDAFTYVDTNFQNVSTFLASDTLEFNTLVANSVVISNSSLANTLIGGGTITGNININNALTSNLNVANSTVLNTLGVSGQTDFYANVVTHNAIVPFANVSQDLGSARNWFRNAYIQHLYQVNTTTVQSDASLLQLHANLAPGDTKDVGVFGKFYTGSSNNFAFFGHQQSTDNFVYKITPTDATIGNSIVADGVYGNVQFGSGFFSNATAGGNTVIITGNAVATGTIYANLASLNTTVNNITVTGAIQGNVTATGNIYAYGGQVITTNMLGFGAFYQGGLITGDTRFLSATPSAGLGSGAVRIDGGLSVLGNINTAGLVGPVWGQIQTAAQPNITSLGVLPTLTANSIQATSIGLNSLTAAGGTVSFQTFTASGNVTVANIFATQFNGTLQGLVALPAQPLITSLGTLSNLAVAGNVSVPNVVATNTNTTNLVATNVYTNNYLWPNGAPYTTTVANTAEISANVNSGYNIGFNLNNTGVIAGSYGSNTYTVTATVDSKGRVVSMSQLSIAPIPMVGPTGNVGYMTVGANLTLSTTNGMVINPTPNGLNISTSQSIQPGSSPTFAGLTIGANINTGNLIATGGLSATSVVASGNIQATNVSASSVVASTLTGTLQTASQTNVTAVGTLTALSVSGSTNLASTTIAGNLAITGPAAYISNNLFVGGSLFVQGNSIQVNSTSVTTNDLQYIAAANAGSIGAADGAGLATPYGAILISAANNAWTSNIGFRATSLFDNGNRVVSTTTGAGNLTISGSNVTLTPTGPGITTAGSITAIPVISTDQYGRVSALTTTALQNLSTTGTPTFASLSVNGAITATGDITASYSDDRLKTRLGNIENALDKIDQLTGFYYEANETAQSLGYKVKREVGVSAQDTNGIMPELVAPAPVSEDYLTVKYDRFAPLLIEGIKELRQEIRAIKRNLGLE